MRAHPMRLFLLIALLSVLAAGTVVLVRTPPIDDQALRSADDNAAEWLMINNGYSEQRYSTLDQIDTSNVAQMAPAWSFEIGEGGGPQEATPLFAGGVFYGITNWSITFAVDARTGEEIWRYDPGVDRMIDQPGTDRLCCGVISRGVALYEDKVIVPVVDGHVAALDAATGQELWKILAVPADSVSYTLTMAPRVINGKIVIGTAGAEFPPFRGYVAAFDVNDGSEVWRFWTVPGNPADGFENEAMERAAETWTGDWWIYGGGGSVWDGMAYDPDANLVYFGTGNGTPWAQDVRQGAGTDHLDNLYVASIVAVDADTGEYAWHYQATPADQWDYDAVQHLMLADIQIDDRERQVVMQVNKNGFFYVIDRITGEFISAGAVSEISWATGIDPVTGRPEVHPDAWYTAEQGVTVRPVQAHNTAQMAFNPATGLVYVPVAHSNQFSFTAAVDYEPTPGSQSFGLNMGRGADAPPRAVPPSWGPEREFPEGARGGILSAWDPATQQERWFGLGGGQSGGGALSTAGNLVFQVINDGRLMAYSADRGELLLEVATGQRGGMSPPMTYELDGKQYVALMGGMGQLGGRGFGGRGRGNAEATAPPAFELPESGNPTLMVFTLP